MNSYALVAFATPVAALLLGWAAVALHRRSLRGRPSPEEQAERSGQQERELVADLDAIIASADRTLKRAAIARARNDQFWRNENRRQAKTDGGTALAR